MASNNEYEQQSFHHSKEIEFLKSLGLVPEDNYWTNGKYRIQVSLINGAIIMTNIVKNGK